MNLFMTSAPCGAGKSYEIRQKALTTFGKHIIAVPTVKLIDDYINEFNLIDGYKPLILAFHHGDGRAETVADAINAERKRLEAEDHVIFVITHDSLLRALDHDEFRGWNCWVDEVLTVRNHAVHHSTATAAYLASLYRLVEAVDEDGRVIASLREIKPAGGITVNAVRRDSLVAGLADLHQRVCNGREKVFTNVRDWAELDKNPNWFAYSIFDIKRLAGFRRVHMFANAITETVTCRLLMEVPGVQVTMVPFSNRQWLQRPITVNYFAQNHAFSQSAIDQFARPNLALIQGWCRAQPWCTEANHFWMKNSSTVFSLPGDLLQPISHGLNSYQGHHAVTVIYKAKPSHQEVCLNRLCGIDERLIIAEREYETISQLVLRSSIRDPGSTEPVVANVYDYQQASHLKRFIEVAYGLKVGLNHIELPRFDDRVMTRSRIRGDAAKTPEEKAALKARQREAHAERVRESRWQAAGKDVEVERRRYAQRVAS